MGPGNDSKTAILPEDFYISSECDTVCNEEDVNNFSMGKNLFETKIVVVLKIQI